MDVGEYLEIGAHDLGMRGHSHIWFQSGRGLAVLILRFEAQDHRHVRAQGGAVAMPHDARAVIEYIDGGIRRRRERGCLAAAVVAAERCAAYLWQVDRADQRPWKSALV